MEEVALTVYGQMADVEWKCPACGYVQTARAVVVGDAGLDVDVLRSRAASCCTNPGQATIEPCTYSTDADYYSPPLIVVRNDLHFRCLPLANAELMTALGERGARSERGIRIVHTDLL